MGRSVNAGVRDDRKRLQDCHQELKVSCDDLARQIGEAIWIVPVAERGERQTHLAFSAEFTGAWQLSAMRIAVIIAAGALVACAREERWITRDGGRTFTNARGGVMVYDMITTHPYRQELLLSRQQPVSKWLSDWRLVRIDPDGTTTLKLTWPGTSHSVSARPGEYFPQPGQQRMRLVQSSSSNGTARIEVSAF
jgi:hypothetical protein